MESPIDPAIFRALFHVLVGGAALASLYSVYHQKYDIENTMGETFTRLKKAKSNDEKETVLMEMLSLIQNDAAKKKASSRLSAVKLGDQLVKLVKLQKDGSNAEVVSAAIKAIVRVFGADAAGRSRLHAYGGYKALLATLSEAHRQGNEDLMEEVADALVQLTEVNDEDLLTSADIPPGAEGCHALATMPAVVKMLRIIDESSPVLFLNAVTGIYANMTMFAAGAKNIGKGTDGHSGISFFLKLLEHSNRGVVENSVRTVRYIIRTNIGTEEVCKQENVERLASLFTSNGSVIVLNSVMTILLIMMAADEHGEEFYKNVNETNILVTLFELYVRHADRSVRSRAEALCSFLLRAKHTSEKVATLTERYRSQILQRQEKDKEEQQRQMQQMQQQQMMQRMMMEQMGIDPSMMMA
ncbi:hypothetical protein AGDE_05901 [Angomonas deanei]|uniref:Uncharacterized protein n=1 Tax=Angomonas deanei TaxID=59799 RepID=A0A7G2CL45_9TRYP|nr:hypothetical protein AGDE_05901 [Angomonas deanei]CAD2218962.1 hypothetical protein, conserved [Angomonas deanei]|eukprot:EPY38031.1 hypothetical protein AGDE_05901 [Angomonas deanei]